MQDELLIVDPEDGMDCPGVNAGECVAGDDEARREQDGQKHGPDGNGKPQPTRADQAEDGRQRDDDRYESEHALILLMGLGTTRKGSGN